MLDEIFDLIGDVAEGDIRSSQEEALLMPGEHEQTGDGQDNGGSGTSSGKGH